MQLGVESFAGALGQWIGGKRPGVNGPPRRKDSLSTADPPNQGSLGACPSGCLQLCDVHTTRLVCIDDWCLRCPWTESTVTVWPEQPSGFRRKVEVMSLSMGDNRARHRQATPKVRHAARGEGQAPSKRAKQSGDVETVDTIYITPKLGGQRQGL